MMRRSGSRPAVCASKVRRDTPRRAANGQRPSRHLWKFAAAARIASGIIEGSPEEPGSPLQPGVEGVNAACETVPVIPTDGRGKRSSCAQAAAANTRTERAAAPQLNRPDAQRDERSDWL